MVTEQYDKNSGAILFKKDPESRKLDEALRLIEDLQSRVKYLEELIATMKK